MIKTDLKKRIHITRGDVGGIVVAAVSNGSAYSFAAGDVVRLQVMGQYNCDNIVLQKVVDVTEQTQTVTIDLSAADTSIGDVINKPAIYWYEIELNPQTAPQTIIGFDESGPKEFILYPEGVVIEGANADE